MKSVFDTRLPELMPYQKSAVSDGLRLDGFGLSTPRQNGKTEVGLEIAIRAAGAHGEKVLFVTEGLELACDAMHRAEKMLYERYPGVPFEVRRTFGSQEIRFTSLAANRILFRSYRSKGPERGQDMRHKVNRVIYDEFADQPVAELETVIKPERRVWLGLGLKLPVPTVYYGADWWDDVTDKDVWRKANPAIGTLFPDDHFDHLTAVLRPDEIRRELLNVRTKPA